MLPNEKHTSVKERVKVSNGATHVWEHPRPVDTTTRGSWGQTLFTVYDWA